MYSNPCDSGENEYVIDLKPRYASSELKVFASFSISSFEVYFVEYTSIPVYSGKFLFVLTTVLGFFVLSSEPRAKMADALHRV